MAGLSQVLNIAKQAILSHQMSMQVAGHNVANVDTPGYTRQTLVLNPAQASPSPIGQLGNGVEAEKVLRQYDAFATQRLMRAESDTRNLEAQKQTLRMLEAAFNEAPGQNLNDLMSKFWSAWQELADNPEALPSRQALVQQGQLLANQLQSMHNEIVRTRSDIGTNLKAAIGEVNTLTAHLARLNGEIAATETAAAKANDLRDQRDTTLKQLAGLLEVNYFETEDGNYTVILPDGHALVENDESWGVRWQNDSLYWIGERRNDLGEFVETQALIGRGSELGGRIGGWLEIYNRMDETDPDSYAGRLAAFTHSFIREVNRQHSQGVGMTTYSGQLQGATVARNTAVLTGTVDATTATTAIGAGELRINDREVGRIEGSSAVNGLARGKAANAVAAINAANAGVEARLTTQVAGNAVTAAGAGDVGQVVSFSIEGVAVSYTITAGDTDPAVFAANLAAAVNSAMTGANVTVAATVGDGTNGGAANSLVLTNTNTGDTSSIVIAELDMAGVDGYLGLANGTYQADSDHNDGTVTLFSADPFTVQAGSTDKLLAHFGWDGGTMSGTDEPDDGRFTYQFTDGGVANGLMGYHFGSELTTDGAGFDLWIYNQDGSLALPQPVTVSLERAYTLNDVVAAVNDAVNTAAGTTTPWVEASVVDDRLTLTADSGHRFAFANDTSGILQAAGLNTFFAGSGPGDITVETGLVADVTLVAAGQVGERGQIFHGDNTNALAMTDLQRDENIDFKGQPASSFDGFYNTLVGRIGIDGQAVNRDLEFSELLATQLGEMRDSTSGVSLDEEMANLIKYQHAYTAAAKLITMSDEMLQTLLQSV